MSGGRRRPLLVAVAVAVIVVAADQATTSWAEADVHRPVHLLGPLGLAVQYNSGTAFSLFTGARWWVVPVVVVLVAGIAWLAWRARTLLLAVGYGLVLGGAVGNLADRLVRGHHGDVVDFVTLSHWPTFNLADAGITVGIVLVAVGWLRQPVAPGHPPAGVDRAGADGPGGTRAGGHANRVLQGRGNRHGRHGSHRRRGPVEPVA